MYALVLTLIMGNGVILQDVPETYMTYDECKKEEVYQNTMNAFKQSTVSFKCESIKQESFPKMKKN